MRAGSRAGRETGSSAAGWRTSRTYGPARRASRWRAGPTRRQGRSPSPSPAGATPAPPLRSAPPPRRSPASPWTRESRRTRRTLAPPRSNRRSAGGPPGPARSCRGPAQSLPARGSTRPRTAWLDQAGLVSDVDRLEVRVDVQRLGARLPPAVARLPQAAERHVRLRPVGRAVDGAHAAAHSDEELLRAMDRVGPDRRREPVLGRVRGVDRLVEASDTLQGRDRAEDLGAGDVGRGRRVLEEGGRLVVAAVVALTGKAAAPHDDGRPRLARPRHRREHRVELAL